MKTNMAAVTGHIKRKMFVQNVVGKVPARLQHLLLKSFHSRVKARYRETL